MPRRLLRRRELIGEAEAEAAIEEAAKQKTDFDFENLDQIVGKLLDRDEIETQIKRWCKKGTYFCLNGDKPGEWRKVALKGGKLATFDAQVKAYLVKTYGDKLECIANEDINKAVDLSCK